MDCFGGWQASRMQHRQGRVTVKCPNCNVPTTDCVKLYLNPPTTNAGVGNDNDDDDDISLSSTSSSAERSIQPLESLEEMMQEEETEETNETELAPENDSEMILNEEEEEPETNADDISSDDPRSSSQQQQQQEALIDLTDENDNDDDNSPAETIPKSQASRNVSSEPSASVSSSTQDKQKYKTIAKKYKRQAQLLRSQSQQLVQDRQTLFQGHAKLQKEARQAKDEYQALLDATRVERMELQSAKVKIKVLQDQCHKKEAALETVQKEQQKIKQELLQLRTSYKRDVEQASCNSLVEVQSILKEHPALLQENQELKQQIQNYKEELQRQQHQERPLGLSSALHHSSLTTSKMSVVVKRKKSDVAKDLQQMEAAYVRPSSAANETATSSTKKTFAGCSGSAIRMLSKQHIKPKKDARQVLNDLQPHPQLLSSKNHSLSSARSTSNKKSSSSSTSSTKAVASSVLPQQPRLTYSDMSNNNKAKRNSPSSATTATSLTLKNKNKRPKASASTFLPTNRLPMKASRLSNPYLRR
jgi:hypothetical protein